MEFSPESFHQRKPNNLEVANDNDEAHSSSEKVAPNLDRFMKEGDTRMLTLRANKVSSDFVVIFVAAHREISDDDPRILEYQNRYSEWETERLVRLVNNEDHHPFFKENPAFVVALTNVLSNKV
jgi:hypothetical protein